MSQSERNWYQTFKIRRATDSLYLLVESCQYCYALVLVNNHDAHESWHRDLDHGYEYLSDALIDGKDEEG